MSAPWARRWVRDLEDAAARRSLVDRARDLERGGAVDGPHHGGAELVVRVRGSQPDPFEVRFGFDPLDEVDRRALAGARVREELADGGGKVAFVLVPAVDGATTWRCSCVDVGPGPCAHVLAAGYAVASWWRSDPVRLLAARGVEHGVTVVEERPSLETCARWLWGEVGPLPEVPDPSEAQVRDLLYKPVARRLSEAVSSEVGEQIAVGADLAEFYTEFLSYPFPTMQP